MEALWHIKEWFKKLEMAGLTGKGRDRRWIMVSIVSTQKEVCKSITLAGAADSGNCRIYFMPAGWG